MHKFVFPLAVFVTLIAASAHAQNSGNARGETIANEIARRNGGFGDLSAELELSMRNAQGQTTSRALRLRVLERPARDQGDMSLVIFDNPADVRGTALLSHAGVLEPDEQWLYLPAAGRVRRISTSNASSAFLGSEFAFEDITGAETGKYTWALLDESACGSARCFRVETRPRYPGSGYTRRVLFVDTTDYRVYKIDFYDRRNALQKTLTYEDYQQHGSVWRSHRWVMHNHQNGRETTLTFRSLRFRTGLTEGDFTPAALERAR